MSDKQATWDMLKNLQNQLSEISKSIGKINSELFKQQMKDPQQFNQYKKSARLCNVLKKINAKTLYDVCTMSDREFVQIEGCGRKTLNEMREILNFEGLDFGISFICDEQ